MTEEKASLKVLMQSSTIAKLANALRHTVSDLIATRDSHPSIPVVALLSRNILELRIWTEFCIKSEEDASTFHLDAIRDFDDMIKRVPSTDLTDYPEAAGLFKQFADARAELEQILDPGELDESYQKVRKAAEDIGQLAVFDPVFKVLSKFAHPTAMLIMMGQISEERYTLLQNALIRCGLEIASEAATISKAFNESARNRFPAKGLRVTV